MHKSIKRIFVRITALLLALSVITAYFPDAVTSAASGFKYYDYQSESTIKYKGVIPVYIIDGNVINTSDEPAIINSAGIALGSVNAVFKKGLGLKCTYDSTKGEISIKYHDNELIMYLGSKTAYLNGVECTANAAPVRIKYSESGIKANLVPTRFVAESLGFGYNWNSSTSTITIKSPVLLNINGESILYSGTLGKVNFDGAEINVSKSPSYIMSDNALLCAKNVFKKALGANYKFDADTGKIVISIDDVTIEMFLNSRYTYINGKFDKAPIEPKLIYSDKAGKEYVYVPGRYVAENLGFDYTWDAASGTSLIKTTDKVGVAPIEEESIAVINPTGGNKGIQFARESYFTWKELPAHSTIINYLSNTVNYTGENNATYVNAVNSVYMEQTDSDTFDIMYIDMLHPVQELSYYLFNNDLILNFNSCTVEEHSNSNNGNIVQGTKAYRYESEGMSVISFELNTEIPDYRIELLNDGSLVKVFITKPYLSSVKAGSDTEGEYITFYGSTDIYPTVNEEDNCYYIELNDTINSIGANYFISDSNYIINDINLFDDGVSNTTAVVSINPDYKERYYIETGDNYFTVFFYSTGDITSMKQDLIIPLPDGLDIDDVSDEDLYYENRIVLNLPGDYREFYKDADISNTGEAVKQIRINYCTDDITQINLYTEHVCGYKISSSGKGIKIRLDSPDNIYDKIIVLDAGHGGTDPGTIHGGYNEKDVNFSLVYKYCRELFDASDIKVYYSRFDDTFISLNERAAYAERVKADLFISVHHNSNNKSSINGTSVYYSEKNKYVSPNGLTSKKMGELFQNSLVEALGTVSRGVIAQNFVVVRDSCVPAVLLEIGFMSNPKELSRIVTEKFQKKAAKSIFDTVVKIFEEYY